MQEKNIYLNNMFIKTIFQNLNIFQKWVKFIKNG